MNYLFLDRFEKAFFSVSGLKLGVALVAGVRPLDPGALYGDVGRSGRNNFVPDFEKVWVKWIAWKTNVTNVSWPFNVNCIFSKNF